MRKIICAQKQVSLSFSEGSFVHLFVEQECEKVTVAVENSCSVQMIVEFDPEVEVDLTIESVLQEKAFLQITPLYFTHRSIDQKFSFFLKGDNSSVDLKGLAVLSDEDKVKIETSQRHQGVGTESSVEVLSLLNGKSSFDYEGIIRIEESAAETNANQQNKNILLSQTSSVRSVPTIEVLNKDVQCFHGSAMGSFDKDQVYYLKSRGLDYNSVQRILVDSFCEPVIGLIPWKDKVKETIQQKLV